MILPGNAAVMILGEYATEDQLLALAEVLGLNRPWYIQYFEWAGNILQADWGMSLRLSLPVGEVVGDAFWNSASLAVTALVTVIIIATIFTPYFSHFNSSTQCNAQSKYQLASSSLLSYDQSYDDPKSFQ